MTIINQKIRAAYEVRPLTTKCWHPQSPAVNDAHHIERQWQDRQRAQASLQFNRQIRRK